MEKAELYWTLFSEEIKQITVGTEHPMYGILADGSGIGTLNHGDLTTEWTKLKFQMSDNGGGAPIKISCGADGTLYAIDENNKFFKYNKYGQTAAEAWWPNPYDARLLDIGVGEDNLLYGIGMGGKIYKFVDFESYAEIIDAGAIAIEVAQDGTVLVIAGAHTQAARLVVNGSPDSTAYTLMPYLDDPFAKNIIAVALSSRSQLYAINEQDEIGKLSTQSHTIPMTSYLCEHSVVSDKVMWNFVPIVGSGTIGRVVQMDINSHGVFYIVTLLDGVYKTYRVSTEHSYNTIS